LTNYNTTTVSGKIAPIAIAALDFDRIPHESVKAYLQRQAQNGVNTLQDLRTTCYQPAQAHLYGHHAKSYQVERPLEAVWQAYRQMNALLDWNGQMVSLGMIYNKRTDTILYPDEEEADLEEGQIAFINMRLICGLLSRATAHEVTAIDEEQKVLTFCYIEAGKSMAQGSQRIDFASTGEGHTIVTHQSFYKSDSALLNRIYPFFHEQVIDDFHHNIQQKLFRKA